MQRYSEKLVRGEHAARGVSGSGAGAGRRRASAVRTSGGCGLAACVRSPLRCGSATGDAGTAWRTALSGSPCAASRRDLLRRGGRRLHRGCGGSWRCGCRRDGCALRSGGRTGLRRRSGWRLRRGGRARLNNRSRGWLRRGGGAGLGRSRDGNAGLRCGQSGLRSRCGRSRGRRRLRGLRRRSLRGCRRLGRWRSRRRCRHRRRRHGRCHRRLCGCKCCSSFLHRGARRCRLLSRLRSSSRSRRGLGRSCDGRHRRRCGGCLRHGRFRLRSSLGYHRRAAVSRRRRRLSDDRGPERIEHLVNLPDLVPLPCQHADAQQWQRGRDPPAARSAAPPLAGLPHRRGPRTNRTP